MGQLVWTSPKNLRCFMFFFLLDRVSGDDGAFLPPVGRIGLLKQ